MSYGIKDVISDEDKIAILIQEDTEAQFECRVSVCDIENLKSATIIQYTIKGRFMGR